MKLFLRLVAGAIATALAVWLVPGISLQTTSAGSTVLTLLAVAALIGLVNAVVKPVAEVLGFCLIVFTFGLFLLVINALMLLVVSWLSGQFGFGFHVDGFAAALPGSLIISIVSALVSSLLGANRKR